MEFTAAKIAQLLGGEITGDATVSVSRLAKIEEGTTGDLSFLANMQYEPFIYSTKASVVIVGKDFVPSQKVNCTMVRVEDAHRSFVKLLEIYNEVTLDKKGTEQPSFISESARLGENCYVGAFVYVGSNVRIGNNVKLYPHTYIGDNVSIGNNSTLFSGVKIYRDCVLGADCTFHSGVIIGGDGFGFAPNSRNNYEKIPQTGNVIIEDKVEVGANTTVDRATLGSTVIRKGAKIDNLIQVAHNVEIGENTVIAAQTGIAGSTKIGRDCMIGGQVGIVGHLKIADKVKIAAQSGIGYSIETEGEVVQGSPAFAIGDYKRSYVNFRNLPEMQAKINELEKMISDLTNAKNSSS